MTRRELVIDFARPRMRWTPLAMSLVIAALIAAAVGALMLWQGAQRIATLQRLADSLQRQQRASSIQRSTGAITPERARSVNDAIRRLNLPWDRIFVSFNNAGAEVKAGRVALLALEPDANAGLVKVTGEARSTDAMLAYQRRLEAQPGIESALLTRHEVVVEDPQTPVRFWIEARIANVAGAPR